MFTAYLFVTFFTSLFLAIVWSRNGPHNTLIKMVFIAHTIWTALILLAAIWPMILAEMPNARLC